MFFAPFALLFTWLAGLLSVALLGGGAYLVWAWYVGQLVGTGWVVGGLLMLVWSFAGRWLVLLLRPAGRSEPTQAAVNSVLNLERPDGTVLAVTTYGRPDGRTVVLTHGAGANSTSWFYLQQQLADEFRLVAWDLPGLGHSTKAGDGDYSLERHARDLEAVIEAAAHGREVVLVGHSMGGMISLTLCGLAPELLRRTIAGVVLVDSSHCNPARTTTASAFLSAIQKPVLEPLLHLTAWLAPVAWVMAWLSYINGSAHLLGMLLGFGGSETRGQLDRATLYNPLAWPGVQAREMLAMFKYDVTDSLLDIPVPVLCVTGNVDRLIVPETSRFIASTVPTGRAVQVAPAGHMSVFERQAELTQNVAEFASSVLGTRTAAARR